MQITCFSGFSKKLNSTKRPSSGTSKTVTLKQPTSVMNPVFVMEDYSLEYNYIQWDERYYYVDDIIIVHNNIAEYHCSTDVLATFKTDIGSSSQYVVRSATTYTPTLADGRYPLLGSASTSKTLLSDIQQQINTTGTYVIGIVNPKAKTGVAYYTFGANGTGFTDFLDYMFSDAWLDSNSNISVEIQKELINPFQYIVSAMWFPLSISGDLTDLKFGYWDSGLDAGMLSESTRTDEILGSVALERHPQQTTNGLYMNGSPYTRYQLNCYSFGSIPLDPAPFVSNNACAIRILVDLFTGLADMTISASTGSIIRKQTAQFGVPVQLSQLKENMLNTAVGVISSTAGSAIMGSALGPGGAIAGGVLGAASGIMNGIDNVMPQIQTAGAMGSKIAFSDTPSISNTFYNTVNTNPTTQGRALMSTYTISSIPGYMECANVALDTSASDVEKGQIIRYMESGFYYE